MRKFLNPLLMLATALAASTAFAGPNRGILITLLSAEAPMPGKAAYVAKNAVLDLTQALEKEKLQGDAYTMSLRKPNGVYSWTMCIELESLPKLLSRVEPAVKEIVANANGADLSYQMISSCEDQPLE